MALTMAFGLDVQVPLCTVVLVSVSPGRGPVQCGVVVAGEDDGISHGCQVSG